MQLLVRNVKEHLFSTLIYKIHFYHKLFIPRHFLHCFNKIFQYFIISDNFNACQSNAQ